MILSSFFYNDTATTEIYTLSLHDALPICALRQIVTESTLAAGEKGAKKAEEADSYRAQLDRSEEHTSELQSRFDLVCRLLLEKKKKLIHACPVVGPDHPLVAVAAICMSQF